MNWCGSRFPTTTRKSALANRRFTCTGVPAPGLAERNKVVRVGGIVADDAITCENVRGQDLGELRLQHWRVQARGDDQGDGTGGNAEVLEASSSGGRRIAWGTGRVLSLIAIATERA